jgi:AcrR family transcriptional regulator
MSKPEDIAQLFSRRQCERMPLWRTPSSSGTRDCIIDAAERVAEIHGAAHLTMDAVAAQGGVSAGGLFCRFPSKEGLVAAMLERFCDRTDAEIDAGLAHHGNTLEGYVATQLEIYLELHPRRPGRLAALLAAKTTEPALMQWPRMRQAEWVAAMSQLPGDCDLALLASYAIWGIALCDILGMNVLDESQRKCLQVRLRELAAQSSAPPTRESGGR